jgi:signal transduction histidine kinase
VAALVPRAVGAVAAEAAHRCLSITSATAPAPTEGDPHLLERLVGNLVENAVRHNVDGGWVRVCTGSDASSWLTVANTGAEVLPADVEELFQPFRRGGTARTGSRGAGLGLSIVRAVAAAHGGAVTATPREGGGLEVTVRLPAGSRTSAPPVPAPA